MTFSNAGGTFTLTGTFPIVYTATGTPTTTGNNVLTKSNTSLCDVVINVTYGNAEFTCTGTSTLNGVYSATVKLDPTTNYISMGINMTKRGNINISTEDKNGMVFKFDNAGSPYTVTGPSTIRLLPGNSTTKLLGLLIDTAGSTPNTSEESSQGANGGNNQSATYQPKNVLTNTDLCTTVTIDVKPRYILGTALSMQSSSDAATN